MSTIASLVPDDVFPAEVMPALPQSAINLLQLSQDPESGPEQFTKPIEADPGLMGQVLKFVNSSDFGFQREITSVHQALTLVGTKTVTNFALWRADFSVTPNPMFGPFELKSLWLDSLRRASLARQLGRSLHLDNSEDLFAAVLLQEMAVPLLIKDLPATHAPLVQQLAKDGLRLNGVEVEMFGWERGAAAAMLAKRWNLSADFILLVSDYSSIEQHLSAGPEFRVNSCMALATLLPACSATRWQSLTRFVDSYRKLTMHAEEELIELLLRVDQSTSEFAPLLKVDAPQRSLLHHLEASAPAAN